MQELENRTVVDAEWAWMSARERLSVPGYYNFLSGVFVPEESAFDYAVEKIFGDEDLKQEFLERFYFNWVKED